MSIFQRAGLDPPSARAWVDAGFEPYSTETRVTAGMSLADAVAFRDAGKTVDDFKRLAQVGLSLDQFTAWAEAGAGVPDAVWALTYGVTLDEWAATCGPTDERLIAAFHGLGIGPVDAAAWRTAGFSEEEAVTFGAHGVDVVYATELREWGLDIDDHLDLSDAGLTIEHYRDWAEAGIPLTAAISAIGEGRSPTDLPTDADADGGAGPLGADLGRAAVDAILAGVEDEGSQRFDHLVVAGSLDFTWRRLARYRARTDRIRDCELANASIHWTRRDPTSFEAAIVGERDMVDSTAGHLTTYLLKTEVTLSAADLARLLHQRDESRVQGRPAPAMAPTPVATTALGAAESVTVINDFVDAVEALRARGVDVCRVVSGVHHGYIPNTGRVMGLPSAKHGIGSRFTDTEGRVIDLDCQDGHAVFDDWRIIWFATSVGVGVDQDHIDEALRSAAEAGQLTPMSDGFYRVSG